MMKKNALLVFCICTLAGETLHAQVKTNENYFKNEAVTFRIRQKDNYTRAMQLAKERNWPLSFTGKNGALAKLVGIDEFNRPLYYTTNSNAVAAATARTNQLWPGGKSGLNLSGNSAHMKDKLGVWDGGAVLASHVELAGKITQKDTSSNSDHATHVSGIMVANGVNPSAKGMAFGTQGIIAYDFHNATAEMTTEAANLLISNHSYSVIAGWNYNSTESRWEFWGEPNATEDFKFGYYSPEVRAIDEIAWNAPFYLIVKAAGNSRNENGPAEGTAYHRPNAKGEIQAAGTRPSGISNNDSYDIISWDCGAKNVLTVGAVNGIPTGYSRKEDVIMSAFSSWGPTDDGRIKPDIVADGVNLLSSVASGNTSYSTFSGTSMASPSAAGSLFLIQEYYSKLKNSTTAFLRSATLKGLAIHTAEEAGNAPGPDYKFGWGLLNVEKAAAVLTAAVPSNNSASSQHQMYESVLTTAQPSFTTTVVASGKVPLTATICWTDVKGTPVAASGKLNNRTKMLVNDLDIRITRGSGASLRTYRPWTLNVDNPSADAVPGDNNTDNVERIDVDTATIPGETYTITVTHKGTLSGGTQAYSLLISGVGGTAFCTSAPTTNTGARIETFGFGTISFTNPAGNTSYTDNRGLVADVEPSQIIPVSIKAGSSDASDNPKMLKVFIDYNNNSSFEAGEQVATSTATLANNATFTANITIPTTATIGNIHLMRVVLQETSNAADINACGSYGKGETQDYKVRVTNPSNDMTITGIVSPQNLDCGTDSMYVTIEVRNSGSALQSNIPLTLQIGSSSGLVANLAATYPGSIDPLTTVKYTFQKPVTLDPGTSYTFTATVSQPNDQFSANNQLAVPVGTAPKPAAPSAVGSICTGTTATLKINNPDLSNYYWYTTPTGGQPFTNGTLVTSTTIPSNNTFYVGKEARAVIGLPNKMVYTNGGYNHFSGNYMKFSNTVPVILETVRLHVANAGKVRITVANIISEEPNGNYSYSTIASTILDVHPTKPNPQTGTVAENLASDTGAIFLLNLPIIQTGEHIINVVLLNADGSRITVANTGASLFRNNGIAGANTYPIGVNQLASFTGNSAHTTTNGVTAKESEFYYFFYDLKVRTNECVSDRVAVVVNPAPTPVITQQGTDLVSNITSGLQWYLGDSAITGATTATYKPTQTGVYKVATIDALGCQKTSNTINYTLTAIDPIVAAREINLKVSPNPNTGVFNLSFEVTTKADISIEIFNAAGQKVYNQSQSDFVGKYAKEIKVPTLSAEVYMLKINHNKKNYVHKIIVQQK